MKNEKLLEGTPEQIEAIEKETRGFYCPCCNTKLQFRARVQLTSVGIADTREEVAERDNVPVQINGADRKRIEKVERNRDFLRFAKETGVLDAFEQAVDAASMFKPKNLEAFFVNWLETAVKVKTPQFALRQCLLSKDLSAGGELELWRSGAIGAILQNGNFKVFIPNDLLKGGTVESLATADGGITKQERTNLQVWVRTRFGYIEKSSEFSRELRKHSIGGFQV
ncbi:MAG TPA: hypothetical protein VIL74_08840 [Pyrinomonadaceae bacterium]|jgi:hypothetical protein